MTLLETHLEQIDMCSQTIHDLPFQSPQSFTNALLHCPDITALIRDTEPHERALFSLSNAYHDAADRSSRRATMFKPNQPSYRVPRRQAAVAAILGIDLAARVQRERNRDAALSSRSTSKQRDDVDIEALLEGAEKLCGVYALPGAMSKISMLRARNEKVMQSIDDFERLAVDQTARLNQLNRSTNFTPHEEETDEDTMRLPHLSRPLDLPMSTEDIHREEEEVAELMNKKRLLEERVSSMERDLGGLMR